MGEGFGEGEMIGVEGGIGKGEGGEEGEEDVRKGLGKCGVRVEGGWGINIEEGIVGDIEGIGYVGEKVG